ncbi:hypothetical protein [Marinomonas sp. GJ51-6]|uniref:hypothetical protein n=1 Tax=Marinomonas sp. GJ51-6 TaxID=2992802 RepID=UPI00293530C2|nr:hypothetical protein [Marinomonas sp. GJ51-6]WOD07181.1 hypothetical protein ONZ50_16455 [Marinomonas sp. GJ51-6]
MNSLQSPEGSLPSKDALVIPNEDKIADLESVTPFETPRASVYLLSNGCCWHD